MELDQVRFKVLELVHRHDLSPEQLIERADKFVAYIAQQPVDNIEDKPQRPRGRPPTTR